MSRLRLSASVACAVAWRHCRRVASQCGAVCVGAVADSAFCCRIVGPAARSTLLQCPQFELCDMGHSHLHCRVVGGQKCDIRHIICLGEDI